MFLIIGICHPIVIKMEYYWSKRSWWVLALAGAVFAGVSLFVAKPVWSTILGAAAFSCFWGIHEIMAQERRVLKGWFPENPERSGYYARKRAMDGPAAFRPMRRSKQALKEEECKRILDNACRGFLSVIGDGGYPYSVPINFVFEDGRLYFHCAKEGHKLDALRACDKACFTVLDKPEKEPGDWWYHVKSVICFGRIRILEGEAERHARLRSLAQKYFPEGYDTESDITRNGPRAEILELTVEHMSGKAVREK